jgi:hypothetical protein
MKDHGAFLSWLASKGFTLEESARIFALIYRSN